MNEAILKVEGMMCSGCENRVKNSISKIEGVKDVKASYESKTVKIKYEDDLDIELVKDKIIDLGYEVKSKA